jgi:membrane fusion protein (multidrug efflux system)
LTGSARGATPRLFALAAILLALAACSGKNGNQGPPPPEVGVIKTVAQPVTVYEEYVAQTEAVDTVEIRARVGGILERQAYVDGAKVKQGDLLFVIDPQPFVAALAQARAVLALAQANHVNSRRVLERIHPLLADQAISQQDLDAAIAREGVDAANVEAGKAQVKTAELNRDYATIRASRDGLISKALIKPGGLVNASTTLLTTLYSIDPIYVNFTISEQRLLELQKRADNSLGKEKGASPAYRLQLVDGSDYKFSGRLNFVDAAVDPKSGTLQVRLSVPNPDGALRAGQFVRVIVPAAENPNAIRLPQQAVQELQGKLSVFVIDAENKVAFREIVAKTRLDNDWVVEGGLKPGETVIVEGINKVRPGMPVRPAPAGTGGNGKSAPAGQPSAAAKPKG